MSEEITKAELKKIDDAKTQLSAMEEDIKNQADQLDLDKKSLSERESDVVAREAAITKKLGIVDAGTVFDAMVSTVNSLYSSYYAIKGTDEGLLEAIQSIMTARQSINNV
jgi:hypothetical protein